MTATETLLDIKNNPSKHKHVTFEEVIQCSTKDGALDTRLMEAHARFATIDRADGNKHDVKRGPCFCGAWHEGN